jgi:hypothetical protein
MCQAQDHNHFHPKDGNAKDGGKPNTAPSTDHAYEWHLLRIENK